MARRSTPAKWSAPRRSAPRVGALSCAPGLVGGPRGVAGPVVLPVAGDDGNGGNDGGSVGGDGTGGADGGIGEWGGARGGDGGCRGTGGGKGGGDGGAGGKGGGDGVTVVWRDRRRGLGTCAEPPATTTGGR